MNAPGAAVQAATTPPRGADLPRHVYPVRTLGILAGFLVVAAVLHETGASPFAWAAVAIHGFLWPHVAFFLARRSADPWSAERFNLVVDSAMVGIWLPLIGFNLLPSILIVSMMSLGLLSVGGPRLLAAMFLAMAASGTATLLLAAPEVRIETSFAVMVACLPLILLYPISIGVASYHLRHRIRQQKQQLDLLVRTERLSGLTTRQHWEEALKAEVERSRGGGGSAAIILVDVDDFKAVNDNHGHPVGDEVIRRMGEILRGVLRPGDVACRYGGDEFGVLVTATGAAGAAIAAERVRDSIEQFRLDSAPELRCTASLGVAEVDKATESPEGAIARADRALYLAKAAGRNRVQVSQP